MSRISIASITAVILLLWVLPVSAATPSVRINNGDARTQVRKVSLSLIGPDNAREMMLSNKSDFAGAVWQSFQRQVQWELDFGKGEKTVYAKFKDTSGAVSNTVSDAIRLEPPPFTAGFIVNGGASATDSRYVTVSSTYSLGVELFQISNESSFAGLSFVPVLRVSDWTLTAGSGEKTVYVRFKDASGDTTTTVKRIMYKEPLRYIPEGTAIKGQGSAVYYFGFDGKIHPFLNSQTFQSWYPDFTKIVYVSDVKLRTYPIGLSMCVRPGTWLVKFLSLPRVYAPEPGCSLRPLRSEVEAFILYGTDWQKRIVEFDPFAASIYKVTSFDVSDKAKNIVDKDRDGLDSAKEASFGSSDAAEDTDSDFLSDFEEIEYWFSDPNDADSDDDGVKDGREIAEKASPLGGDAIREVPANTYVHPVGSLLRDVAGKFYYLARDGTLKSVSTRSTDVNFTSNNFQERFAVWPPIRFKTTPPEAGSIGRASLEALRPKQTDAAGNVVDL